MERHVVIGTAGHIDHGKTTLVKALTGVDTDRLAEEKSRGITIDLGFAPLELAGMSASIVDVPGHEGFIRNMVAGATGIDLAMLVVAADEGVMPQTREHLAILRLLGVSRGIAVLTKCDLAPDSEWRALVADELSAEIRQLFGSAWPVVEASATTGDGLDALRSALGTEAGAVAARSENDRFRLPVDRVFALPGAGTIVTGTAWSGMVHEGDQVRVLPGGHSVRVRSIQVHGAAAVAAGPGRRAALAVVGVGREEVRRGSVVVSGEGWRESRILDVVLTLLPNVALKARQRVRFHHGTSEIMARVARLEPVEGGLVARLVLDQGVVSRAGDRFVVRSWSPVTTIGGGLVTDPWADECARGRQRAGVAHSYSADTGRVAQLIRRRGTSGMTRAAIEVAAGLDVTRLTAVLARGGEIELVEADGRWFAGEQVARCAAAMMNALTRYHAANPLEAGMPAQAWRAAAGEAAEGLVSLAEREIINSGSALRDGSVIRLASFTAGADAGASRLMSRVLAVLAEADAEPPSVGELRELFPGEDVGGALRLLARSGAAVAVSRDRYYAAEALDRERTRLAKVLEELGTAAPAAIRDRLGRSRKWLIPLLEWADREGLTVRDGDRRRLVVQGGA